MNPSRTIRARVAATLVVVVAALSVAVPLLDRGLGAGTVALTEPGAAPGYVDHHHIVCVQHSATAWSAAAGAETPLERYVAQAEPPHAADQRWDRCTRSVHHSRAPPLV